MSKEGKSRFRQAPEFEQYSKFKGKKVRVKMPPYTVDNTGQGGGFDVVGILIWIDMYTLGIKFPGSTECSIVYKGPGMIISLA